MLPTMASFCPPLDRGQPHVWCKPSRTWIALLSLPCNGQPAPLGCRPLQQLWRPHGLLRPRGDHRLLPGALQQAGARAREGSRVTVAAAPGWGGGMDMLQRGAALPAAPCGRPMAPAGRPRSCCRCRPAGRPVGRLPEMAPPAPRADASHPRCTRLSRRRGRAVCWSSTPAPRCRCGAAAHCACRGRLYDRRGGCSRSRPSDPAPCFDPPPSRQASVLGDILAGVAAKHGWQGLVVNGCVRDAATLPGCAPRAARGRARAGRRRGSSGSSPARSHVALRSRRRRCPPPTQPCLPNLAAPLPPAGCRSASRLWPARRCGRARARPGAATCPSWSAACPSRPGTGCTRTRVRALGRAQRGPWGEQRLAGRRRAHPGRRDVPPAGRRLAL